MPSDGNGLDSDSEVAATEVVRSLGWLRWSRRRVVVIRRGDDDFWSGLVARLIALGLEVREIALDPTDRHLCYRPDSPPLRTAGLTAGDLLIHHDPLLTVGGDTTCDDIRMVVEAGAACVSLEFPSGQHAFGSLRHAYLRALSVPVDELRALAGSVRKALASSSEVAVLSGPHALAIGHRSAVFDDYTAPQRGAQLLQLPLGEVWILPDTSTVHGRAAVVGARGRVDEIVIAGGRVVDRDWQYGDLVEVGVGVNRRAHPLPTALSEKAAGRLHLGFGDAALMGGDVTHPRHADLYLVAGSRLTYRRADGRSMDLADVFG